MKTLDKKSTILLEKAKFFLIRAFTYLFFLCFPMWIPKVVNLAVAPLSIMLSLYIVFMAAQWFLLGKEIDHRLKIYFRVNSSIDRLIYRLFMGMFFMLLWSNLLSLLPGKWIYNCFWITWAILGLFYSWPTRGKIIQESMSSNLSEFRFLDSFEKTLLGLILLLFIISIYKFPNFETVEALKLYFDPNEKLSPQFWNFLTVNYYPFKKYPNLLRISWGLHFYIVGAGLYLLSFYAILRFFLSRRLSLLGVFGILTSWQWVKVLEQNVGDNLVSMFTVIFVWSLLWGSKSSTYRSGLFVGLVGYWATFLSKSLYFLNLILVLLIYLKYSEDKTYWYKRQFLKYTLWGIFLATLTYIGHTGSANMFNFKNISFLLENLEFVFRKSFYAIAFIGLIVVILKFKKDRFSLFKNIQIDNERIKQLACGVYLFLIYGVFFEVHLLGYFSLVWVTVFLALIPLEVIFQSINRLRSGRNIIYVIYIVLCLLDSHFEVRVKNFISIFN